MKKMPAYILTGKSLTIVLSGKALTINHEDARFQEVRAALFEEDLEALETLLDFGAAIAKLTFGDVKVFNDKILFRGQQVHNVVADKLIDMLDEGLDVAPLAKFLDKVMKNPSQTAQAELYLFLEKGKMPITEDGDFLALRKVDENYLSYNKNPDGTQNRNRVGDVVKMDRGLCDTDRNRTCSTGLHFCSYGYLPEYYGGVGKVVVVKINPTNITAIPSDHGNAKGRCCEYRVVAEIKEGDAPASLNDVVYSVSADNVVEAVRGKFYHVRDKRGRFTKYFRNKSGQFASKGAK